MTAQWFEVMGNLPLQLGLEWLLVLLACTFFFSNLHKTLVVVKKKKEIPVENNTCQTKKKKKRFQFSRTGSLKAAQSMCETQRGRWLDGITFAAAPALRRPWRARRRQSAPKLPGSLSFPGIRHSCFLSCQRRSRFRVTSGHYESYIKTRRAGQP